MLCVCLSVYQIHVPLSTLLRWLQTPEYFILTAYFCVVACVTGGMMLTTGLKGNKEALNWMPAGRRLFFTLINGISTRINSRCFNAVFTLF